MLALGPFVVLVIAMHALLATDWFPHPGELFGCVVAPIGYTVAMVGLAVTFFTGGDDWSAAWILLGSVVLAAVSLLWAWNDYRRRP